jgi:hypothetical protein
MSAGGMVDFHTHVGRMGKDPRQDLDAAELVRKMDRRGIETSIVLPLHDSPSGWYLRCTTEDVIRETGAFPDRLVPFCQVDPRFGDHSPDTDFRLLLEEYKARGCRGMGEVTASLYFDDPMVVNLMRQCGEAGLPVVFHTAHALTGTYGLVDDPGLPRLERLIRACPGTVFCAHGPAFWSEMGADPDPAVRGGYPKGPIGKPGRVAALLDAYPNLYGDLSAGSGYNALTRTPEYGLRFLEQFQDRLLFATDTLRHDMEDDKVPILALFRDLRWRGLLSEAAYRKITRDNARRLLALAG